MRPGDVACFRSAGALQFAIRMKTWSSVNHVSVYVGNGTEWTARKSGANFYPFSTDHLAVVLRPVADCHVDPVKGNAWGHAHAGVPYDTLGLLSFFRSRKLRQLGVIDAYQSDNKLFCSEAVAGWFHAACAPGQGIFADNLDFDEVSPGMFLASPHLTTIWVRDVEEQA